MEIAVWNNPGCFFVERNDCYPKTNKYRSISRLGYWECNRYEFYV